MQKIILSGWRPEFPYPHRLPLIFFLSLTVANLLTRLKITQKAWSSVACTFECFLVNLDLETSTQILRQTYFKAE